MIPWTVRLTKSALREFRKLPEDAKLDVLDLLEDLKAGPDEVSAIELQHYPRTRRARFHHDSHRIIYEVSKSKKLILVIRIRPRPTAYEGMKRPDTKPE